MGPNLLRIWRAQNHDFLRGTCGFVHRGSLRAARDAGGNRSTRPGGGTQGVGPSHARPLTMSFRPAWEELGLNVARTPSGTL